MIDVLIADDHELIRDGFRKLFEEEEDIRLAGEAASAGKALELLRGNHIDIAILDIGLPDKSGIEVLKDIRAEKIDTKVLMLSMHPEMRYAHRALRNGAAGYLTKDAPSDTIIRAIHAIYRKGSYITDAVAEQLYQQMKVDREHMSHEQLSDREYQILLLIGKGESVRTISEKLSLSTNTINSYRRRLLEKMNFKNNAEIVQYVTRHDLLE
ncbi:MAG: response regulator [Spirochaetia bacterium]